MKVLQCLLNFNSSNQIPLSIAYGGGRANPRPVSFYTEMEKV
jgi:hypothetical protein